jgi:hypothetical protein
MRRLLQLSLSIGAACLIRFMRELRYREIGNAKLHENFLWYFAYIPLAPTDARIQGQSGQRALAFAICSNSPKFCWITQLCVPKTSSKTPELAGLRWITLDWLEKVSFQFISLRPLAAQIAPSRWDDQLALPFNSAFTRSGVNGTVRSRVPVASYTALASAAPTAEHAASPGPSGGSFGRSTRSMSSLGRHSPCHRGGATRHRFRAMCLSRGLPS